MRVHAVVGADRRLHVFRPVESRRIDQPLDPGVAGASDLELYVEAGLTPLQALQAATIVPARAMKLDADLGTIEKGKRADIVVLNANPLERIQNIRSARWTIVDGRVYDTQALWRSVRFQP